MPAVTVLGHYPDFWPFAIAPPRSTYLAFPFVPEDKRCSLTAHGGERCCGSQLQSVPLFCFTRFCVEGLFEMKKLIGLLSLLFLAASVQAQDKLPEYGTIGDLKGMARVYVATDSAQQRKFVLDELKKEKSLEVVSSPDEAQFTLKCWANAAVTFGSGPMTSHQQPFEMTAYTIKDGRQRIAWSETKTSLRYAPMLLTRDFIKALKKSKAN